MTEYMKPDRYGAPYVDITALAVDLAPLLGGIVSESEDGAYGNARIVIGDLRLYLRNNSGKPPGTVYVGGGFLRETALTPRPNYRDTGFTFPHASATISKGLPAFAKDIKRRVVDASAPILERWQDYEKRQHEQRENMARNIAALAAACPGLEVRPEPDGLGATIWGRGDNYLRGRLHVSGEVSLDRLATFPVDRLPAVLKAVYGET